MSRAISAVFPFRPALLAIDGALNGGGPAIGASLAHLAALALAYLAVARAAVARPA